jgi:hypothetical protein
MGTPDGVQPIKAVLVAGGKARQAGLERSQTPAHEAKIDCKDEEHKFGYHLIKMQNVML